MHVLAIYFKPIPQSSIVIFHSVNIKTLRVENHFSRNGRIAQSLNAFSILAYDIGIALIYYVHQKQCETYFQEPF